MPAPRARLVPRVAAAGIVILVTAAATPAGAHGVGTRGDLPLPTWQVAWGAAVALVVSFAGLGLLWVKPRLAAASPGRTANRTLDRVVASAEWPVRVVFLAAWAVVVSAGLAGIDNPAVNITPIAVFVVFWVGLQVVSAVLGGFLARVGPFDTIVALVRREGLDDAEVPPVGTVGAVAVAAMFGFLWLELAYHTPAAPRVLGWALAGFSAVMIAGGIRHGRGWLRANDPFAVLASLIGSLAPVHRREDARIALRAPFAGLTVVRANRWTVAFVLVVLGSTTFDGMGGVDFWTDVTAGRAGWELTGVNTVGIVWVIAVVSAVYHAAAWFTARLTGREQPVVADDFVSSLVPIMLAYSVAHYFSLLVFEGQNFLIQASDPYGEGWDLFGTQGNSVDFLLVSTATIAWVQVVSIVVGHVAGVAVAHDRAVERHRPDVAIRSQYPMLAAMVAYTVAGLLLLLNA